MKTNRNNWLRRLAFIVGTVWVATQAPAQASVAPTTVTSATQAELVKTSAEQPHVTLASASCTRVGTRMVC